MEGYCVECGVEIPPKRKVCSEECRVRLLGRRTTERNRERNAEINQARAVESTHPDEVAAFIEAFVSDPEQAIIQRAADCGLPAGAATALVKRLQERYQPVVEGYRAHSLKQLLGKLDEGAHRLVDALDDETIQKAKEKGAVRDLAIALGVLIDKKQLLSGQPTQILTVEERKNLSEVLPALLKEAERRGMTVDLHAGEWSEAGPEPRVVR